MSIIVAILVLIALLGIGAALLGVMQGIGISRRRRRFLKDHLGWDNFFSPYDGTMVAVSPAGDEIALGNAKAHRFYRHDQILSAEILRDDGPFLVSASASQLAGVAIGGMAFGWWGALAGAAMGNPAIDTTVKQIELAVTVRDPGQPPYRVTFFRSPRKNGSTEAGLLCRHGVSEAERFRALLYTPFSIQSGPDSVTIRITVNNRTRKEGDGPVTERVTSPWTQVQSFNANCPIGEIYAFPEYLGIGSRTILVASRAPFAARERQAHRHDVRSGQMV